VTRDDPYDAIVVGSGITGGWAAKELCERGLKTLVLERGRHVEHGKDYVTEWLQPWQLPHRGRGEQELYERDYPVQSKHYAFGDVSGERLGLAHLPDGEFLPPWQLNCAEQVVKRGIERVFLGRHMTITRVANLTEPHNGRGRCQARNQCARGCSYGGYFSSLSATLPAAQKTGNLTVLTDAIVHSVIYD